LGKTPDVYISLDDATKLLDATYRTLKRYMDKGEVRSKKRGRRVVVHEGDVRMISSKVYANKCIHRPDTVDKPREPKITPKEMLAQVYAGKTPQLLDNVGVQEIRNVQKHLEDAGLAEYVSPTVIMKYAILQQMWFHYTTLSLDDDEYRPIANDYQKQVFQYEKELGLVPSTRLRMKTPQEEEGERVIDPMEALLNGD
jgi:phage terminase small subunit